MNSLFRLTFLFTFQLPLLIFIISCEESTKPYIQKSVREYSWNIDTLHIDANQNYMRAMWASSSDDVYLVGHSSGGQIYEGDGGMWHFNGKNWEVVRLLQLVGGGKLYDIDGSSSENIWAVGERKSYGDIDYQPYVIQYNGSNWIKHNLENFGGIYSVLVVDYNDIWACGQYGLIYHFNGINWKIDTLRVTNNKFDKIGLGRIVGTNKEKYILGHWESELTTEIISIIYENNGGDWQILDSSSSNSNYSFGVTHLYYSTFDQLFSVGPDIYKRNAIWEKYSTTNQSWIWGIFDNGESNILTVGTGEVIHFNGSNWQEIIALRNIDYLYRAVWLSEDSAFIVGHIIDKTIVWKGN